MGEPVSASVNTTQMVSKSVPLPIAQWPRQHLVVTVFLFLVISGEYIVAGSHDFNLCFSDG